MCHFTLYNIFAQSVFGCKMEIFLKVLPFAAMCAIIIAVKKTAENFFGERIKSMSKGKTVICVCAMVASCVTGGVMIADSAVSGHTVGKMNSQEVFSFENQQLANTMPTFTTPIGETKQTVTTDTTDYSVQTVPAINQESVAETMTEKITGIYTESYVTDTVLTEEAVTVITDSTEETHSEVVTTAITTAVTTVTTTTTVSTTEETTTTTTTTTAPETTTTTTTPEIIFTEPVEWLYMETQPVQVMDTEPVYTEPVYTEPVHTEPVYTEPVYTEPVYTEPEVTYTSGQSYISESDFILLCNAVAHEAGSDWIDIYSKANVVEVIMNRVNSPLFPNTVYEVLSQPYQFEGSETYTGLGCYSYQVTDSVIEAVNLYFSDPYSFSHGYMYFYGDGYQNHFSVSQ